MEDLAQELHGRGGERVVLGELELGREDAALERGPLGPLDEGFPLQQVVFGDRAGSDAIGWVVGQRAILLQEPSVCGRRHGAGVVCVGCCWRMRQRDSIERRSLAGPFVGSSVSVGDREDKQREGGQTVTVTMNGQTPRDPRACEVDSPRRRTRYIRHVPGDGQCARPSWS